jgi:fused signal recognition particle receptor
MGRKKERARYKKRGSGEEPVPTGSSGLAPKGLASKLAALFGKPDRGSAFFEQLEALLIEGDVGPAAAIQTVEELRIKARQKRLDTKEECLEEVAGLLGASLEVESLMPVAGGLNLYLLLGVNGVGKTTTLAKLAHHYRSRYGLQKILFSAADTFRAAAIDQLSIHGRRMNIEVVSQAPGADPAAVIFDTISKGLSRAMELVLVDTAGRMHNRADLVRELSKIDKVIRGRIDGAFYRKLLVLDATTGQNALVQAEIFHEAVGVDSLILAKYDSSAKGGVAIPIGRSLRLPFSFMGTGEKMEDLVPFNKASYLASLTGLLPGPGSRPC